MKISDLEALSETVEDVKTAPKGSEPRKRMFPIRRGDGRITGWLILYWCASAGAWVSIPTDED